MSRKGHHSSVSPTEAIEGLRERHRNRLRLRGTVTTLVVTAIVVFLTFGVFFKIAVVRGNSMVPAINNGDLILTWRFSGSFQRGDVILFRLDGRELVKRVAGVPGDNITVESRSGRLLVNGDIVDNAHNVAPTMPRPGSSVAYPMELDANEYFLLGDNRVTSDDSRSFGAVLKNMIDGKVILLIRTGS